MASDSYGAELADMIERKLKGQRAAPSDWDKTVKLSPAEWQHVTKALRGIPGPGWRSMVGAPCDRPLLAVVDGSVRVIRYGKTSHVSIHGWCLADQGAEEFDICKPTAWMPMPELPSPATGTPQEKP